jgi:hypothetical protein
MILPFSTKLNDKPTYFVEKIQTALRLPYFNNSVAFSPEHVPPNMNFYVKSKCQPKLHTIREDKKDRWKSGTMIDFFINTRTKDMFRFAPRIPVVITQTIEIIYHNESRSLELSKLAPKRFNHLDVIVDNNVLEFEEVKLLAQNDGFDDIYDFFFYFNQDFTGKIIHWTDKRY